jgi:hypothetical protein
VQSRPGVVPASGCHAFAAVLQQRCLVGLPGASNADSQQRCASGRACLRRLRSERGLCARQVDRCTNSLSHCHVTCPCAHHGEKARRRCPVKYRYTGLPCPDFRKVRARPGLRSAVLYRQIWCAWRRQKGRACCAAAGCCLPGKPSAGRGAHACHATVKLIRATACAGHLQARRRLPVGARRVRVLAAPQQVRPSF